MDIKVINYMKWRKLASVVSIVLVLASIFSLATQGLVLGLDFTGGTQIEVGYERDADLATIRTRLADIGIDNPVVVYFGSETDVLIKFKSEAQDNVEERVSPPAARTSSCGGWNLSARKSGRNCGSRAVWGCWWRCWW